MASIIKEGGFVALLIILIVISSSSHHTIATARTPHKPARQLATDCNSPRQGDVAGCGGGSSGSPKSKPKRISCGSMPGSSSCKKGCCGKTKFGEAICC